MAADHHERLKLVVALAASDGVVPEEKELLQRYCASWGLSNELLESALKQAEEGTLKTSIPDDEQERLSVLTYLIGMARADGVISRPERAMLEKFGVRLGMKEDDVTKVIERNP